MHTHLHVHVQTHTQHTGLEELVEDWLEVISASATLPGTPTSSPLKSLKSPLKSNQSPHTHPQQQHTHLQQQQQHTHVQQQQQQLQHLQHQLPHIREWALAYAKKHLAWYLGRVREVPGLVLRDEIDTLLLLLLCEVSGKHACVFVCCCCWFRCVDTSAQWVLSLHAGCTRRAARVIILYYLHAYYIILFTRRLHKEGS